jgi:hypothetical protein
VGAAHDPDPVVAIFAVLQVVQRERGGRMTLHDQPDCLTAREGERRGNCEACGKRRLVTYSAHGWHDEGSTMTLCRECDADDEPMPITGVEATV